MSTVTVAATGNDIRGSLVDFRGLLTFPRLGLLVIYDLVRWLFSAMFHCKNNKTTHQNKPAQKKSELERLLLTTSVRGRTASTADPSVPHSLWTQTSLMTADLWRCFTYRTYRGRLGQGGRMRSFSQFGTIYTTAGSGHASLCSKRERSDLQSNESLDDN